MLVEQVTASWSAHETVEETKLHKEGLCVPWVEGGSVSISGGSFG